MKFSKEAKVGLFAVLSIGLLYIGFNYLKGVEFWSPTNKYYVIYGGVAGLQESNPVKINGFSVGRVSNIEILQQQDHQILVELDIADNIQVGDSTVALLDVDLLGSVSIVLEVGPLDNILESGDTIPGRLDKALEDLLKESALPVADNLQVTIRRVNTILEGLTGNTEKITNVLTNLEVATRNAGLMTNRENRQRLSNILANLEESTASFKELNTKFSPVLEKYGQVADSLKTVDFKTTLTKTNQLLDSLSLTIDRINNGSGTLTKLMTEDSLYVSLQKTIEDLDKLVIHFNENPKHFMGPLGKSRKKIQKDLEKQAREN